MTTENLSQLDKLIRQKHENKIELVKQLEGIQKQQAMLEQRRQELLTSYHQLDGAITALHEVKTQAEPAEEGT